MTDRPILFSAPMIRALLAGAKTQTRRVIKPDGKYRLDMVCPADGSPPRCPYGVPGDRLWVRESWGYRCSSGTRVAGQFCHTIQYRADDERKTFDPMPMDGVGLPKWVERTDGQDWESWDATMTRYWRQWRPSIHMPRWASRILLEVTEVRVERLQGISRGDAMAEGCPFPNMAKGDDPRQWYAELWEQINGPGSWDANPWVWVLSFRRIAP